MIGLGAGAGAARDGAEVVAETEVLRAEGAAWTEGRTKESHGGIRKWFVF